MKFLEKYDFRPDEIEAFVSSTPKKILDAMKDSKDLIETNLGFLKSLEINTYRDIFIDYPDMFFMDPSTFQDMFNKYEKQSLIEKLNTNYKMVEYL